jgi:type IV pilus assembly protein PilB
MSQTMEPLPHPRAAPDAVVELAPVAYPRFSNRPKLGQVLLSQGHIDEMDLETALETQVRSGERLGRILVEAGTITEVELVQALAEAGGHEFVDLDGIIVDPMAAKTLSEAFCRRNRVVPTARHDNVVSVAMADPSDVFVLDDMRTLTKLTIQPIMADEAQIKATLDRLWQTGGKAETLLAQASSEADQENDLAALSSASATEDAPVVQFVNELFTRAVHERASDIHLEPTGEALRVRFRVDGVTRDVMTVPRSLQAAIVSRLKIMGDMNIAERRIPQDGRITLTLDGLNVDVRLVTLPTAYGECLVMRLLDRTAALRPLTDLGFLPESLARYADSYTKPFGAILVTGPTGSGKSTTLYATLNEINDPGRTIVTVEDPIEYRLPGLKQIQVNPKAGLTFANALRAILRADPDVVFVGEIRDVETARIAVEAALTGHKVLSSLHTNSASATPARLVEMGVEPYLVTSALTCVVAQRLVRQLCRCREPFEPTKAELDEAGWPEGFMPAAEMAPRFCHAKGCVLCLHTGYRGRLAVHEVLLMTPEVNELVLERAHSDTVEKLAVAQGMITMRLDGLRKAAAGLTTLEEVLRVVPLSN